MAQTAIELKLDAQVRDERGKEKAKKMRRAGKVPGIVYGTAKAPMSIVLDGHELHLVRKAAHGDQVLIDLNLASGEQDKVFIKDVQRDPVTSHVLHVDLLRVDMTRPITLEVAVHQVGSVPLGVREGGMLEQVRYKVGIRCLPGQVPAHVDVDLTELGLHQGFHVADLPQFEGVEYLDDPDTNIFSIVSKAMAEAEAPAPAAAEGAEGAVPAKPEGEVKA